MELNRKSEADDLYKKAQNILLHEMTEDEQKFVAELGFENRATMSPDMLSRLRELVRKATSRVRRDDNPA
jgi:hypothetical protein